MPAYIHTCTKHGPFERLVPMAEAASYSACPACGESAPRDYKAEHPSNLVGMVDGESSGYYPRELGWPVDPKNPMKRIAPSRRKALDSFKRANDETRGAVANIED